MNPDQVFGFCESHEVEPPVSANNAAAENVFSNTLIWKSIGSYLNVGDLKACRLVNSEFHGMIMKETNFLQRCVVSLKPDQITRNIFGSTRVLWKNVLLSFKNPRAGPNCTFSEEDVENLDWLYPLLSNVETVSLRIQKGIKYGYFLPLVKLLLLAPKRLKSLAMEPIFLLYGTEGDNLEELKEVLGNLEEFEILHPTTPGWMFDIDGWADIDPWMVSFDFTMYLDNLRVVKTYYPQTMVFTRPRPLTSIFMECQILTSVLTKIAVVSSKTLEHVSLAESRLTFQDRYSPPLPFVPNKSQPDIVTRFFEAMPVLQKFDFTARLRTFPMEILNVIEERSEHLRKLKIESVNFLTTKWEFLENMKLEEFQLGLLDSEGNNHVLPIDALSYLPPTIRRLFLRGTLMSNPVPALKRLNPILVTELTFINSGGYCFGDDAIKYIRENFVMLRKLNVTNAMRVTDAGFIGSSSGSGSLSGIKGLRTLILRACGSITNATLREIRFLELCHLDLAYNLKLTEDGFQRVLSNNSSLETLLTSYKSVYQKRKHLCASHPRLSAVIYREWKTKA